MTDYLTPFYGTSGPRHARIVVVAEAWGATEEIERLPLVGASGQEFDRMLSESGLSRDEVFCTNVVAMRPAGNEFQEFLIRKKEANSTVRGLNPSPLLCESLNRLYAELDEIRPELIIAAGNYALWALTNGGSIGNGKDESGKATGKKVPTGINSWRGSMLYRLADWRETEETSIPVLPIIHPAAILRQWELRHPTLQDLTQRVPLALENNWRPAFPPTFLAPPSFAESVDFLETTLSEADRSPIRVLSDIETARGLITCVGFATSPRFGIAIPFVDLREDHTFDSYWTIPQEVRLLQLYRRLFSHPNVLIEGQNYLYDTQYIDYYLGVIPRPAWDSMYFQHLMWPGTPKALDYLSSLYCEHHWYWKDDNKEWDMKGDLPQHLRYNCVDTTRNYEVITAQRKLCEHLGLGDKMAKELRKQRLAFDMTRRGIRLDINERLRLRLEVMRHANDFQQRLAKIVPQSFVDAGLKNAKSMWYTSPPQTMWVLYRHFGLSPITHRKTGNETSGKEALNELRIRHPKFRLLFDLLTGLRSLGVFQSTFLGSAADPDDRMRCFFGLAETFRWTSSTNAFGRGANLQNIPEGNEDAK